MADATDIPRPSRYGKDAPRLCVRFGDELARAIEAEAERRGVPRATVVRDLVAAGVRGERRGQ